MNFASIVKQVWKKMGSSAPTLRSTFTKMGMNKVLVKKSERWLPRIEVIKI